MFVQGNASPHCIRRAVSRCEVSRHELPPPVRERSNVAGALDIVVLNVLIVVVLKIGGVVIAVAVRISGGRSS
jgi:hypothetical protein